MRKFNKPWLYVATGILLMIFSSNVLKQPNLIPSDIVIAAAISITGMLLILWGIVRKIYITVKHRKQPTTDYNSPND